MTRLLAFLLVLTCACSPRVPEPPRGLPAVAISSGTYTSCAALTDGTVRCWGSDLFDPGLPLSDRGLPDDRCILTATRPLFDTLPRDVPGLSGVGELAVGFDHACAYTDAGEIWCWGGDDAGPRGAHTVARLDDVTSLAAGSRTTCALRAGGDVWCWGDNDVGQLGDGTTEDRATPAPVLDLDDAVRVSVGTLHACALREDGRVSCWGGDPYGALGDPDPMVIEHHSPFEVPSLTDVIDVAVGHARSCALTREGTVLCWGDLGTLDAPFSSATPVLIGSGEYVSLHAGWSTVCALTAEGTADCWGAEARYAGFTTGEPLPLLPRAFEGAVALSIGEESLCARDADGVVSCRGGNVCGELGDGTVEPRPSSSAPVPL